LDEYVRAGQHVVGHAPLPGEVRARGESLPYRVQAGPAGIEGPLDIAHNEVAHTVGQQNLGTRGPRSAGAHHDDFDLRSMLFDDPKRIHQRGEYHDRRSVLVIMEDRNVEFGAQAPLDLEATWRRDVLQVDRTERGRRHLDEINNAVDVLGRQAQRERIDSGKLLEQQRLTFHHGHRGLGADVAQSEHRRPV
jgi:hypothetical protein